MEVPFLPKLPLPFSDMALFGLILLAGVLGDRLTSRTRFLPKITGYLLIGFLLGRSGLGWLGADSLAHTKFLIDIAVGIVLFDLGRRLDLTWLRNDRALLVTALVECAVSFLAIGFALYLVGLTPLLAALAAAIGISTSPAIFLMVARELGAEGQVTRRAANLVAFNNAVALLLFAVLLSLVHANFSASWVHVLLHPAYLLLGSVLLGAAVFAIMLGAARFAGKQEQTQFILLVGAVLLAVGVADALNLSVLLSLLTLGICTRNFDRRHHLDHVDFGHASEVFVVLLFVVAGASMRFENFPEIALAASVFIAVRAAAKLLPSFTFSRYNRLTFVQGSMLGLLLMPLATIALSMTQSVELYYPSLAADLNALMITSVTVLEILGPIITQYAFKRSGEARPMPAPR